MGNWLSLLIAIAGGPLVLLVLFHRQRLWGAVAATFSKVRGNRMLVFGLAVF